MDSGILTKYNASAGSGKTYNLTAIYLSRILRTKSGFKKILAVTFTHKAASDLKRKILNQLRSLSRGEKSDMDEFLISSTGKSFERLSDDAREIIENILYNYSFFSVGTIDSFFQRVLKAFTREINLQHGYVIELDHSVILRNAVDNMIADSSGDGALRNWLAEFSDERIEEGKNWDLKKDILKQAEEIFREKFRLLDEKEREKLRDRELLNAYASSLRGIIYGFRARLKEYSERCNHILDQNLVTEDMFLNGNRGGVPTFLRMLGEGVTGTWDSPGKTVMKVLDSPPQWATKAGPSPQLKSALENGFDTSFTGALKYYIENYFSVNTAVLILENVYTLGILSDVLRNVHEITSSENKFLLSDAGELLYRITAGDQAPFIYEKIGTSFENYMIDEFQDTSHIQWNNFRPLITDSMAQGFENLVVGDIKQAIYRWRNSDWSIFGKLIDEQIGTDRILTRDLDTNWRSRKNVILFNNSLFKSLPLITDNTGKFSTPHLTIADNFRNSVQQCPPGRDGGFANIRFIAEDDETGFREKSLALLPAIVEELQDYGYSGSDIGILVRRNSEGAEIMQFLLDYQSTIDETRRGKYNYNTVSSDSLLLVNSHAINFIISLLYYLLDDDDDLNKTVILRNWLSLTADGDALGSLLMEESSGEALGKVLPEGFQVMLGRARQMPLFEATENIIDFFRLGQDPGNTPYLSAFQDSVLEYSGSESPDLPGFLEWWESTGIRKSVILTENRDSMRVMTIHKSKGLEFKVVILPFLNWSLGHAFPPTLWLTPGSEPFNRLRLLPVRYSSQMENSLFADAYYQERFSAAIDNLNLLYVAFTRAVDGLVGLCPDNSRRTTVATLIKQVFTSDNDTETADPIIKMKEYFNETAKEFRFGSVQPILKKSEENGKSIKAGEYPVTGSINRLRLRFHGDNWLIERGDERGKKINYGRIMHEILETVNIQEDIPEAVRKKVLEGRIPVEERSEIESRLITALADERVKGWFSIGLNVLNEAAILVPGGESRRPDRIILGDNNVIVIDFKFGDEKTGHIRQVVKYKSLLDKMGYRNVSGYLWYVDRNYIKEV